MDASDREKLLQEYRDKRKEIEERLKTFHELRGADDWRLFKELTFVILTSRSGAEKSWEAAEKLEGLGLLRDGSRAEIAEVLQEFDIQYEENKADYIVRNREDLSQPTLKDPSGDLKLKDRIDPEDARKTREQLVENLHGIGWKGASHFLRNIGYGDEFAIVSAYIAKKLHHLGFLDNPEPPADREGYLKAERKLEHLAEEIEIDVQELDLLLWSTETGEVFK